MYQKIIIIGNLGANPVMKFTPDGKAVTNFSVATSRKYKDTEETTWFRVSTWDKQAEACNQYLRKGSKVFVTGRLVPDKAAGSPRTFQRDDGTWGASFEIMASEVKFLDSKPEATRPDDDYVPF